MPAICQVSYFPLRTRNTLFAMNTAQKHGTEWKNSHPVVTVFLEKLIDLNRYRVGDSFARDEDFRITSRLWQVSREYQSETV